MRRREPLSQSRRRTVSLFCAALTAWTTLLSAAEHSPSKRVYLAPDDHTDYLWSLDEEDYRRAFLEMLDYYLDQIDATIHSPDPHQARWNCDGSFWLWTYEKNKPPQDFDRLISRIRDGHISAPMTALVSCYGGQPVEAVLRGMYYAGSLDRWSGASTCDFRWPWPWKTKLFHSVWACCGPGLGPNTAGEASAPMGVK